MIKYRSYLIFFVLALVFFGNCTKNGGNGNPDLGNSKNLTIFFVNDQHGQLDNFAKIKQIVEKEKEHTNVILACSGDIFSGNPVVDNHPEKGYPIIDVMNRTGFDISVIGNHEFDYGDEILADRVDQAKFDWVCANVDVSKTSISPPSPFESVEIDGLKVTFLGLVETNGKDNGTIPSTHPWKVKDIQFERPENVVADYATVKNDENSDIFIALTHLGHSGYGGTLGDYELATQYPYFDIIIGGHSHYRIDTTINNIPVFQADSYLRYMGKIELKINSKKVESYNYSLINLDDYSEFDAELKAIIDDFNDLPYLQEVVGFSQIYHGKSEVGCFFTDALRETMEVNVTFQNTGGIRSDLDQGDITKREIFEIDPFNNGIVIYTMSVAEIKNLLIGTGSGFYYSGVKIEQIGNDVMLMDLNARILLDETELTVGINDYVPAVHDDYFPSNGEIQPLSSAESLIYYLENIDGVVNYPNCENYFRFR